MAAQTSMRHVKVNDQVKKEDAEKIGRHRSYSAPMPCGFY